ncbi:MAG: hypothetical protein SO022_02810 [Selenomonadaceae bacterium]|nr:hypothetical protein [Selenomonadaceae bacterium]
MNNVLNVINNSIPVALFLASLFSYIVLRPIYNILNELKEAIKELRTELKNAEKDRRQMNERIIKLEESIKSAHHRIDELRDKLQT